MTKNEFLEIIGGIDSGLIESTLDITLSESELILCERPAVLVPCKRKNAFKYITCAAALSAVVFAVSVFVRNFNGITTSLPSAAAGSSTDIFSENSTDNVSKPEYYDVLVDSQFLEKMELSTLRVRVYLSFNDIDGLRNACEEKYNVDLDSEYGHRVWLDYLSDYMERLVKKITSDHNIKFEDLESFSVFTGAFSVELDKGVISQLLKDERIGEIRFTNVYVVDCDFGVDC